MNTENLIDEEQPTEKEPIPHNLLTGSESEAETYFRTTDYSPSYYFPYNPDPLVSGNNYSIYDEMTDDDQVKAAISIKKDMVVNTGWLINGDSDEVNEFITDCLENMNREESLDSTFDDVLRDVLSAYSYGFSLSEPVFEIREGKYYYKSIKVRPPHSFMFHLDDKGNILKITQNAIRGQIDLEPSKFLHHVYQPEFGNPYGKSDLRSAHSPWKAKKFFQRFFAIYVEKFAAPTIVGKYPRTFTTSDIDRFFQMLKTVQHATTLSVQDGVTLEFQQANRDTSDIYIKGMNFYNMQIARSILVPDLIGLGGSETQGGSYALGKEQFKVFLATIKKDRESLSRKVTNKLIRPLVEANFGDIPCWFEFKPFGQDDMIEYLKIWTQTVGAKIYEPNDEEINHFRSLIGFPEGEIKRLPIAQPSSWGFPPKKEEPTDEDENKKLTGDGDWITIDGKHIPIGGDIEEMNTQNWGHYTTPENVESIEKNGLDYSNNSMFGKGVYLTNSTKITGQELSSERIDVKIKLNKTLVLERDIDYNRVYKELTGKKAWNLAGDEKELIKLGYDSIYIKDVSGEKWLNVFDKSKVVIKKKNISKNIKYFAKRKLTPYEKKVDFKHVEETLDKAEDGIIKSLTRSARDIYNDLIAQARDSGILKKFNPDKLESLKPKYLKDMNIIFKNYFTDLFKESYNDAQKELFPDKEETYAIELLPDEFLELLKAESFKMVGDYSTDLTKKAKNILIQAMKDGYGVGDTVAILRDEMEGYTDKWLSTVVRTKTNEIYNEARKKYWETDEYASQLVEAYQWSAILDDRTSEICEYMDGKIFDKEESQSLKPPAHFNCRSILVPLTKFEPYKLTDKSKLNLDNLVDKGGGLLKPHIIDTRPTLRVSMRVDKFGETVVIAPAENGMRLAIMDITASNTDMENPVIVAFLATNETEFRDKVLLNKSGGILQKNFPDKWVLDSGVGLKINLSASVGVEVTVEYIIINSEGTRVL